MFAPVSVAPTQWSTEPSSCLSSLFAWPMAAFLPLRYIHISRTPSKTTPTTPTPTPTPMAAPVLRPESFPASLLTCDVDVDVESEVVVLVVGVTDVDVGEDIALDDAEVV